MNLCRTSAIFFISIFLSVVAEENSQTSQKTTYNVLNGTCQKHFECGQIYSRCINNKCRCIEGYTALDNECVLNTGKRGDLCRMQRDCKGRFTYCNDEKRCQCINGFKAAGQDCASKDDDGRCQYNEDCSKPFSSCNNGNCICNEGYYLQGESCISDDAIIGDVCTFNENCKVINSVCRNQHCVCNENYFSQGYDCVPENGSMLTKRESLMNYKSYGFECKVDGECDKNMFCHQEVKRCFCQPGFFFYQSQCELLHPPPPHLLHILGSESKPIPIVQPLVTKLAHQGLFGAPCSVDQNCDQSMTCHPVERKCICRPGFLPIGYHCIHIHALSPHLSTYPGYNQPNPTHTQQQFVSNPALSEALGEKPTHTEMPLASKLEDQKLHMTISERKPAHGYGYPCTSSADCVSEHLYCHPTAKRCACNVMFKLEGYDCVRHINTELKPGKVFKQTISVTSKISHGHACKVNNDCYHEGLVCNPYTLRCVCATEYYLDGDFCVMHSAGESPTIHVPNTPEHPNQPNLYGPTVVQPKEFEESPHTKQPDVHRPNLPHVYRPNPPHVQQPNPPHVYQPNSPYVHRPNPPFVHQPTLPYEPRPNEPRPNVHQPNPSYVTRPNVHQPNPSYVTRPNTYPPYVTRPNAYPSYVHQPNPIYYPSRDQGKREVECISHSSCTKPFSYCNISMGTCDCMRGYNKISQNCVKDGVCYSNNDCKGSNTYCINYQCECYPDYYRSNGNDCFYLNKNENYGRIGDFCYDDDYCSYEHSHCFQQRCQCADSFSFVHGTCQPEVDYFGGNCHFQCDTQNTECDVQIHQCKCKIGYTRYIQTCIPDGELFGRCTKHNRCNRKELTCQRSTAKCVCDKGYKELGFGCTRTGQPGSYFN